MKVKPNRFLLISSFILLGLLSYMAMAKDSLDYQRPIAEKLVFNPNRPDNLSEDAFQKMGDVLNIGMNILEHLQCQTGAPSSKIESMQACDLKEYLWQHPQDSLWCEQYAKILWCDFKNRQIEARYVAVSGENGNHSFVECAFTSDNGSKIWASLQPTSSILIPLFRTENYTKVLNVFDIIYCQKTNIDIGKQKHLSNEDCQTNTIFKDLKYFKNLEQVYIYRTFPKTNRVYKLIQKLQAIPYRTVYTAHPSNWGFYIKILIVYLLFMGSLLVFLIKKILWILKM